MKLENIINLLQEASADNIKTAIKKFESGAFDKPQFINILKTNLGYMNSKADVEEVKGLLQELVDKKTISNDELSRFVKEMESGINSSKLSKSSYIEKPKPTTTFIKGKPKFV